MAAAVTGCHILLCPCSDLRPQSSAAQGHPLHTQWDGQGTQLVQDELSTENPKRRKEVRPAKKGPVGRAWGCDPGGEGAGHSPEAQCSATQQQAIASFLRSNDRGDLAWLDQKPRSWRSQNLDPSVRIPKKTPFNSINCIIRSSGENTGLQTKLLCATRRALTASYQLTFFTQLRFAS